ncbi:MAG: hypothetical protein IT385_07175 [Deltaproteobacteria bacterium]|nr:hypothetical protein [Deltaproteobacteria bacterium]
MELTPSQRARYARHVLLPEVAVTGQLRILAGAARVVGAGRAAEEAATYLAAAGVGRLGLEPALAERIGARLAALNPDTSLVEDDGALLVAPADPERRAAGAEAALVALLALAGVVPA